MTPNRHEDFEHDVKLDVEARVLQGPKAVLEEVLEEEMTQHLVSRIGHTITDQDSHFRGSGHMELDMINGLEKRRDRL